MLKSNQKPLARLRDRAIQFLARAVCTMTSSRMRRLFYISSILALVRGLKYPEKQIAHQLNAIFALANYDDTILPPMAWKSAIWMDIADTSVEAEGHVYRLSELGKEPVTPTAAVAIGEFFYRNSPKWLRYGNHRLMVEDVCVLIKEMTQLRMA